MNRAVLYSLAVLVLVLYAAPVAYAAEFPHWGPLLTCGGENNPCTSYCDLLLTIQSIIYFGLTLVVFVFAPIMITVGGIMILVAGGKEEMVRKGKATLYGAVTGVAVALIAWALINTVLTMLDKGEGGIDVKWGEITCDVSPAKQKPTTPTTPTATTTKESLYGWTGATPPSGTLTHEAAVALLQAASITTNRGYANCTYEGQTTCTSLTGIPRTAIDGVIAIKNDCECTVVITGGTEAGHATHRMGLAILDLRPDAKLNSYIYRKIGTTSPMSCDRHYTGGPNRYFWEDRNCNPPRDPHWHVTF